METATATLPKTATRFAPALMVGKARIAIRTRTSASKVSVVLLALALITLEVGNAYVSAATLVNYATNQSTSVRWKSLASTAGLA